MLGNTSLYVVMRYFRIYIAVIGTIGQISTKYHTSVTHSRYLTVQRTRRLVDRSAVRVFEGTRVTKYWVSGAAVGALLCSFSPAVADTAALGDNDSTMDSLGQCSRERAVHVGRFASELFSKAQVEKSHSASQSEGGAAGPS